ncbi:hypothetical protein [Burkholderia multivorans]|uniref:hypothetical protein n=1 Tax=Burkholderia multivorans TaxID=87883 RepID=UPI0015E47514|nr:hypothetical protein [Burkholderia multivorans]
METSPAGTSNRLEAKARLGSSIANNAIALFLIFIIFFPFIFIVLGCFPYVYKLQGILEMSKFFQQKGTLRNRVLSVS